MSSEREQVVGAAALGLDLRGETHRGWQADLRVIVPFRGRGIGRALMEYVVAQARGHGVPALHAWEWVEPESDAARAWAALGFTPFRRKLEYDADIAKAIAPLLPLYEEVRSHDWIPDSARIIPLRDADHDAVVRLHVQCLGGSRRLLVPLIDGAAPDHYDPEYSRVLVVGGQVVGFTLGRVFAGGVCDIDANVLAPAVRMGWANLWLKLEAAQRLLAGGFHTIRYFSLEQHTDTQRISRQMGCRLIRTLVQMRREILPAVPSAAAASAGA